MTLPRGPVQAIAHLARLEIDERDLQQHASELSGILDLVDQLAAIDISDVEPLANPLDMVQRLRPDEVSETDQRDSLLAAAPASDRGLFLVPKVIE